MYIDTQIENIINDNMMNYSQYVIKNRALPCIYSGMKPIHLRILWSMYENKTFDFTKSRNVAGKVTEYSPHGDCYPTVVNMVQKDRHKYNLIDGQGNWGSSTSTELSYAADRYTECKMSKLGRDCMQGIEKNMVEMIDNYDSSKKMPRYLPVRFPLMLCMASSGIAVGMANNSPSFNLKEVCDATINHLSNKKTPMLTPDFATGGYIINNKKNIEEINLTGRGSVEMLAKYEIEDSMIKIKEIPYGVKVTVETIIDRIVDLNKNGRLKEVTNVLDQTGKDGLSIEIECRKGTDMEKLMQKLYALTPLKANFSANMNVLIEGSPKVTGVKETIEVWSKFRQKCVKNGLKFDIDKLESKLHLLHGLEKVLLDIDEAIKIIRFSDKMESELKKEFLLEKEQINYIVSMKLSNINEKYIKKQLKEIEKLEKELSGLQKAVDSEEEINKIIIKELKEISDTYGKPRMTEIISPTEIVEFKENEVVEDYNCKLFITEEHYIKKIPLTGLRASTDQKLKDGDVIISELETTNNTGETLIFTNKANCHKRRLIDLPDSRVGDLGEYLPNVIDLEKNENIVKVVSTNDFKEDILFVFKNGKIARASLKAYETKQNRQILKNAFNIDSELIDIIFLKEDRDLVIVGDNNKILLFCTSNIRSKASRTSAGVQVLKLKKGESVSKIIEQHRLRATDLEYYRGNTNRVGNYLKKDIDIIK